MKVFRRCTKSESRTKILAMLATLSVILTLCAPSVSAHASPFGTPEAAPVTGLAGWVLAKQAMFYRALSGTLLAAKNDGLALWTLMGIAFIYGVFHAVGPGHGKAVISSYLLANDETWRRGVTLAFASALVQSLTAVLIVGFGAALLGATAKMMGEAVRAIEIASYGLIVLLGSRLLWVKGLGLVRASAAVSGRFGRTIAYCPDPDAVIERRGALRHREFAASLAGCGQDHAGTFRCERCDFDHEPARNRCEEHDHAHEHELDVLPWGHAHGPEPQDLGGPDGWKRGLSAVAAVGLRPCSGAIILLVFALSQGLFWAGVASTFVMGLGTAITVAVIATLSVSAKAFVRRFATDEIGYSDVLVRTAEVGAAALVLIFGILLLGGYMVSERLVGF